MSLMQAWRPGRFAGCVLFMNSRYGTTVSSASLTAENDLTDAAWTKTQVSADDFETLTITGTAADQLVSQTPANRAVTSGTRERVIRRVKYVDVQWLRFGYSGNTACDVFADIQNGTIGSTGGSVISASISAVDGDGYRVVSITQLSSTSGTYRITLSSTDTTITRPASGSVKIREYTNPNSSVVAPFLQQDRASAFVNAASRVSLSQATVDDQIGLTRDGRAMLEKYSLTAGQSFTGTESAVVSAFAGDDLPSTVIMLVADPQDQTNAMFFGVGDSAADTGIDWGLSSSGTGNYQCRKSVTAAATNAASGAGTQTSELQINEWFGSGTVMSMRKSRAASDPSAAAQNTASIAAADQYRIGARGSQSAAGRGQQGQCGIIAAWGVELSSRQRLQVVSRIAAANRLGVMAP